jgi:hypothetical protein
VSASASAAKADAASSTKTASRIRPRALRMRGGRAISVSSQQVGTLALVQLPTSGRELSSVVHYCFSAAPLHISTPQTERPRFRGLCPTGATELEPATPGFGVGFRGVCQVTSRMARRFEVGSRRSDRPRLVERGVERTIGFGDRGRERPRPPRTGCSAERHRCRTPPGIGGAASGRGKESDRRGRGSAHDSIGVECE